MDDLTDDSLKILKEYHAKDPRLIVIDQQNTGKAGAKQMGLDVTNGNSITFIDDRARYLYNCL